MTCARGVPAHISRGRKWSISVESPVDSAVALGTATDIRAIAELWIDIKRSSIHMHEQYVSGRKTDGFQSSNILYAD